MQLSRQIIIPTQDVLYSRDVRCAIRAQCRDDQRRAAAQVLRAHVCAVQRRNAVQPRLPPRKCDRRAEFAQLGDVAEAVFKDRLRELRPPPRAQQRRHDDRLRVGRKAGIGRGLDRARRAETSVAAKPQRVAALRDLAPARPQNVQNRLKRPPVRPAQRHIAAARRRGAQIRRRFDAVGQDGECCSMQQRATLNGNFAAVLLDLRPGGA